MVTITVSHVGIDNDVTLHRLKSPDFDQKIARLRSRCHLDELGDRSRYVEYWWRGAFRRINVHRDVDEALCERVRIGGFGVARCPAWPGPWPVARCPVGPVGRYRV